MTTNTAVLTGEEFAEMYFGGAEVEELPSGGRQSALEVRYDLIDPEAAETLAHVLWYGAMRYGDNNWKLIPCRRHLNSALNHIFKFLAGDKTEDHLGHAFTRLMFAIYTSKHPPEEPQ